MFTKKTKIRLANEVIDEILAKEKTLKYGEAASKPPTEPSLLE